LKALLRERERKKMEGGEGWGRSRGRPDTKAFTSLTEKKETRKFSSFVFCSDNILGPQLSQRVFHFP